jgi:hypothetical protein
MTSRRTRERAHCEDVAFDGDVDLIASFAFDPDDTLTSKTKVALTSKSPSMPTSALPACP